MSVDTDRLLDTRQAAARLGLAPNTLEIKRVTGGGPSFVKLGRSVRYRIADLDNWVAERVVNSTSQVKVAA